MCHLHLKNPFCISKVLHVKTRAQFRLGILDSIKIRREDKKVINIHYHYDKSPIVILGKDPIIGYALSETQRLKFSANLLIPLLTSFLECMIESPDKTVTSI